MIKIIRLMLLQIFTEDVINPIYFNVKNWYERRLKELTEDISCKNV